MSITLHIERLVLDDALVGAHAPARIEAAIRGELERLLAADGLSPDLAAGGAHERLSAGQLHLVAGTGAQDIGIHVGQAIHGALHSPSGGGTGRSIAPTA